MWKTASWNSLSSQEINSTVRTKAPNSQPSLSSRRKSRIFSSNANLSSEMIRVAVEVADRTASNRKRSNSSKKRIFESYDGPEDTQTPTLAEPIQGEKALTSRNHISDAHQPSTRGPEKGFSTARSFSRNKTAEKAFEDLFELESRLPLTSRLEIKGAQTPLSKSTEIGIFKSKRRQELPSSLSNPFLSYHSNDGSLTVKEKAITNKKDYEMRKKDERTDSSTLSYGTDAWEFRLERGKLNERITSKQLRNHDDSFGMTEKLSVQNIKQANSLDKIKDSFKSAFLGSKLAVPVHPTTENFISCHSEMDQPSFGFNYDNQIDSMTSTPRISIKNSVKATDELQNFSRERIAVWKKSDVCLNERDLNRGTAFFRGQEHAAEKQRKKITCLKIQRLDAPISVADHKKVSQQQQKENSMLSKSLRKCDSSTALKKNNDAKSGGLVLSVKDCIYDNKSTDCTEFHSPRSGTTSLTSPRSIGKTANPFNRRNSRHKSSVECDGFYGGYLKFISGNKS